MAFSARLSLLSLMLAAGIAAASSLGHAAPGDDGWVSTANSRVRLNLCDPVGASAKAETFAFLEMELAPGWKTYWRMPGDSGVSPTFDWAGASNVATATPMFPAPHRMEDQGGEAIGYKSGVIFPIRLQPQDPQKPVGATLEASFGICKNICVPVEIKLTGACYGNSLATTAALEAIPRAPGAARSTDPKLLTVTGSVTGAAPRLTFDVDYGAGARDVDLFIEAPEGLYVPLPGRSVATADGRARFTVDLSKAIDAKDLLGKQLRLTMVSSNGAVEALWLAK